MSKPLRKILGHRRWPQGHDCAPCLRRRTAATAPPAPGATSCHKLRASWCTWARKEFITSRPKGLPPTCQPLQLQCKETAPWTGSRSCCMLLTRVPGVWLARIGHWPTLQWHQFHKLDQDRLSFRHLAVVVQRARGSSDAGTPAGQSAQRASPPSVVQSPRATCLPRGFYDGVGRWEDTLACGPFTTRRRRALQIRDREMLPDSLNDVDCEWWALS